jgi:hypothetical protein
MKLALGVGLACVGVLVIGGPVFGLAAALSGHEIHVRGGAARAIADVVLGIGLLMAAGRVLSRQAAA